MRKRLPDRNASDKHTANQFDTIAKPAAVWQFQATHQFAKNKERFVANNSLFINESAQGKFTVEPAHSNTPLHTANTQADAIAWAKKNHPDKPLHVARVRHLNDKNKPDHWRKV